MFLNVCKKTFHISQKVKSVLMWNLQHIIDIWRRRYRQIFKSALAHLWHFLIKTQVWWNDVYHLDCSSNATCALFFFLRDFTNFTFVFNIYSWFWLLVCRIKMLILSIFGIIKWSWKKICNHAQFLRIQKFDSANIFMWQTRW